MEGFGERAFSLLGPPAALSSARRVFSRSVRTSVFRFRVPRDFRSTVLAPESAIPSRYTRPARTLPYFATKRRSDGRQTSLLRKRNFSDPPRPAGSSAKPQAA